MKKLLFTLTLTFVLFSVNALTYNVTVQVGANYCNIAGEMAGCNQLFMTKVDATHSVIEIDGQLLKFIKH